MMLEDRRREALRSFIAGYLHGRSSLGNHEPAGHEAEAAFDKWWIECGARSLANDVATRGGR
jgi:hypothetical protein